MDDDVPASTGTKRRTYRAAGREEQKRETQRRLMDCALRHFSDRGFEGASLRDIGAEAGVTHALIRLHYGSKEELWRAAIDAMFERQDEELGFEEWLQAERLTLSGMRDLVHRYVRYCARYPEHIRIMVHESLRDSERVRWMTERHTRRVHEPFVRLFTRAIEEGLLPAVPMPSLLYILTSAAETMFALGAEVKHVYDVDVDDPEVVRAHADAICALLLRPVETASD